MKKFNAIQGAFWLLAAVIGAEVFQSLIFTISCVAGPWFLGRLPEQCGADLREAFKAVFGDALAAAMAFAAGNRAGRSEGDDEK